MSGAVLTLQCDLCTMHFLQAPPFERLREGREIKVWREKYTKNTLVFRVAPNAKLIQNSSISPATENKRK